MPDHIQVSIPLKEDEQDVLISDLSDLGAIGFEQTDTHLIAFFEEDQFPSYDVQQLLAPLPFLTTTIKQRNWNEEWEKGFEPVVVDGFCAIRAHFHTPVAGVQHDIIITPKMSFGTGHHATTYMMLKQMQAMEFHHKSVFDFGTGTGILSILAHKLGASYITAIDNDNWSIENAVENFERNDCEEINIFNASVIPPGSFDVILANINKHVILQNLPQINRALNENGVLLLSGLLKSDETETITALNKNGMKMVTMEEREIWISLLCQRR